MPKALPKGAAPKFFVHNPDTMDRHDYKDVYAYIEHSANNGFYIVQGFDVSQWFKGIKQSFFASVHHMATTIPMLRLFAPRVVLNGATTTLEVATLTVQAHIAALLKYLLLSDNYDLNSLRHDGRTVIDMDHVFARLKALYPAQAPEIVKTIEPGFAAVLAGTVPNAHDLIKVIDTLLNDKEPTTPVI